jgi:hypothetical protein
MVGAREPAAALIGAAEYLDASRNRSTAAPNAAGRLRLGSPTG